jgi:type VI secretion system protein ImpC
MSTAPDPAANPATTAATTTTTTTPAAAPEPGLLDRIIAEGRMARDDEQKAVAKDLLGEFVDQVMAGTMTVSEDTQAMINRRIAEIDALISRQLNAILHQPEFQQLEGTWRGLHYLVDRSETGKDLKIKVLNAPKKDLLRDMERAPEFDQSALFKKVYEEEFGTFGGAPFGALVGDYHFGRSPQDLALLEKLSNVAAAAHAPLLTGASPHLFNWDSFTEMAGPRDLAKIFETAEYTKWRSFRESEDARYVGLCLPHILLRLPYGRDTVPVEGFAFEESVDGTDHAKYLWGNAAWALGARLTDAYAKDHWCAAIRGVEGGGLVAGLPAHTFTTDQGDVALKCPTEIAVTDRREKELADLGFISLVHCKNTDYAAFFSAQSAQVARSYNTDAANANARLATQLPYILSTARFAHYLKAIMRDKVGSFLSRADTERYLNTWITQYVTPDDTASAETKAKFPLRDARIDVVEDARRPGCYKAIAFLRPHFQLDELTVSLRLVAELPPPAGK